MNAALYAANLEEEREHRRSPNDWRLERSHIYRFIREKEILVMEKKEKNISFSVLLKCSCVEHFTVKLFCMEVIW